MPDYDDQIAHLARQLRLGGSIVRTYRSLDLQDKSAFVYNLLQGLYNDRCKERGQRNTAKAGFETIKRLDDYEFGNLELPNSFTEDWLKSLQFIADRQNLVLLGNPGTGKTHLATALGVKACENGDNVLFRRTSKLVNELVALHEANQMPSFWKKLERCKLLILDEWGYVPVHQTGTRLLFEVISNCYEKRSVVITTNLPVMEWNRIFGDERLTCAMLDRICHHGILIRHLGQSYRTTHSPMVR